MRFSVSLFDDSSVVMMRNLLQASARGVAQS